MNRIRTILLSFFAVTMLISCDKGDKTPVVEYLDVNPNNISGTWRLSKLNGEDPLEGTYVYLDIVRKDKTYTLYQNLDSFQNVPHVITGSYFIETDPQIGAIIQGNYDHDAGDWSHRYIIRELTEDSMVWIAKDEVSQVQKFVRVDAIPEDIKGAE